MPRLGSACPNSGIDPWAAATGHPWPGYPRFNACVRPSWLTGRSDQDQNQERDGGLAAGLEREWGGTFPCRSCRRLRTGENRPASRRGISGTSPIRKQGGWTVSGLVADKLTRGNKHPRHKPVAVSESAERCLELRPFAFFCKANPRNCRPLECAWWAG